MSREIPGSVPVQYSVDGGRFQIEEVVRSETSTKDPLELGEVTPSLDLMRRTSLRNIVVAMPHGPCRGVEAALDHAYFSLERIIQGREAVHMHNPLVHNDDEQRELEALGAILHEEKTSDGQFDMSVIPTTGVIYWITAHSASRHVTLQALERRCLVQDFSCRLVDVEMETIERDIAMGRNVVYNGVTNHPETNAAASRIPEGRGGVVTSVADISKLNMDPSVEVAIRNQTTLSQIDIREKREAASQKFPRIYIPMRGDGCYATDERQEAVVKLAPMVDAFVVVTGPRSNNGRSLGERAKEEGIPIFSIENADAFHPEELFPPDSGIVNIGITSSASTRNKRLGSVINRGRLYGAGYQTQDNQVPVKNIFPVPRANLEGLAARFDLPSEIVQEFKRGNYNTYI